MAVSNAPETMAGPSGSAERLDLQRVLASRSFAKSPRLSSLLAFIVDHSLQGRHEDLTEQQIGMHVFGRVPGYNSSEDTIVRVTVRQLRQRLEIYYSAEGADDPMRIDIPKGSYVATVESAKLKHPKFAPVAPFVSVPAASPAAPPPVASSLGKYRLAVVLLTLAVIGQAIFLLLPKRRAVVRKDDVGPLSLWQAIFTPDRKTLIVPGDAALDNYIVWEQQSINLEQYATQDYQRHATTTLSPSHTDVPLSTRSITPMADLAFVSTLTRAADRVRDLSPEVGKVEIRYARDVAVADTHDNNLILIGSDTFNPWSSLYYPQMDFTEQFDFKADTYTLTNKVPKAGEAQTYVYARSHPSQNAYTHIALLTNSQGTGRVLIVDGTTMGSTYGAQNFLTRQSLYDPVLKAATDSSGKLRDFEVVLSGNFVHGGIGNTRVAALHVH